jgi:hypothetical protein
MLGKTKVNLTSSGETLAEKLFSQKCIYSFASNAHRVQMPLTLLIMTII